MEPIHSQLRNSVKVGALSDGLKRGETCIASGLWGAAYALIGATLMEDCHSSVLLIAPTLDAADAAFIDFGCFFSESESIRIFPESESLPSEDVPLNREILAQRLQLVRLLQAAEHASGLPRLIIASVQALQEPVIDRELLGQCFSEFRIGQDRMLEQTIEWLVDHDFERLPQVESPGEFSVRGGILDIFPLGEDWPVRIEYFGDTVDSMRRFDPSTQRSEESLESIRVLAVKEEEFHHLKKSEHGASLFDYLPQETWVFVKEPTEVQRKAEQLLDTDFAKSELFDYPTLRERWQQFPNLHLTELPGRRETNAADFTVRSTSERFTGELSSMADELKMLSLSNDRVVIACHNSGERDRLKELLDDSPISFEDKLELHIGTITRGFEFEDIRVAFVGHQELFHRAPSQFRPTKKRRRSVPIEDWLDLNPGDYVVHVVNGIARYLGMERFERNGEKSEFLALEFAEGTKVYVPVTHIDLVQKYVGPTRQKPQLSKIGTLRWSKKKEEAREAVEDLAQELLHIQALRETQIGFQYPDDDEWQGEFEAAFPFEATEDQVEASLTIKSDMQKGRPMDRLLCGDVGYGKTEVAMRAAFKAVMNNKQVAVLCPTTVLAQQHYRTFSERMAAYPIAIDVISRFRSKQEQNEILKQVREGSIDILIGTHRLVQADMEFRDLGLLVIDEEQRFGVKQKEFLKWLRQTVGVLTMTATPIPRTLHMSLMGIRDISALNTPPADRQSIRTTVCRFDARILRDAILREMKRKGQVFFVHNRVYDITQVAARLSEIVPEARIVIGHGQLSGAELEACMMDFINHRYDILVCTTIIGSGTDIPNVNTIFVHEADIYGLADLHQLRGRVGRYKHRAFAYFLLPEERPAAPKAVRRLKALEEFSDLGAGFKIAMRDLEIRGAGNILGEAQSGQIGAVGYDLYCKLLDITVRQLKQEPIVVPMDVQVEIGLESLIPSDYIPGDRQKMEIYRHLSRCHDLEHLEDVTAELQDRFGKLPPQVENLLLRHRVRILSQPWEVSVVRRQEDRFVLQSHRANIIAREIQLPGEFIRQVDGRTIHIMLPGKIKDAKDALDFLLEVLSTKQQEIPEGSSIVSSALMDSMRPD